MDRIINLDLDKIAIDLWDSDHRLCAISKSSVTLALLAAKSWIAEDELSWKRVEEIAMEAIVRMLHSAYVGDADLAARMERDRYRVQTEDGLRAEPQKI